MEYFKNTENNCSSCGFRIAELALMQPHLTSSRPQHVTAGCRKAYELVVLPSGLEFVTNSNRIRLLILESKRKDRHYTLFNSKKTLLTSHVVSVSGPVAGSSASASRSLVGAAWPRCSPPTLPSPRPPADRCVESHKSNSGLPITRNFEVYTGILRMCMCFLLAAWFLNRNSVVLTLDLKHACYPAFSGTLRRLYLSISFLLVTLTFLSAFTSPIADT